MASSSSAFFTKSIVLIGIFLISGGVSLYMGKMMGRGIMDLTRSSIQEKCPEVAGKSDNDDGFLIAGDTRSSFGYSPEKFGTSSVEWANPPKEQFSVLSEEPEIRIEVQNEPQGEQESGSVETEEVEEDSGGSVNTSEGSSSSSSNSDRYEERSRIFSLSDGPIFRIQVGVFQDINGAQSVWRRLNQAGYDAHISSYTDGEVTRYKVQVGEFRTREAADAVAEKLRGMNFDAWVIQIK